MKIDNFFSEFSTGNACKLYFKSQGQSKGIICRKCRSTQHYWIKNLSRWQCKGSKKFVSLKCGMNMENLNLPCKTCLCGIYFCTQTKKSFLFLRCSAFYVTAATNPFLAAVGVFTDGYLWFVGFAGEEHLQRRKQQCKGRQHQCCVVFAGEEHLQRRKR